MKRYLLALLLGFTTPASAETHVISNDLGGEIVSFIAKYVQWRNAGDEVRIEGACYSACSLMLGILNIDKICATAKAQFGFHSASVLYGPTRMEYSREGTEVMWFFYQGRVRHVLADHGWPEPSHHPELLMIYAQEFVKPCVNKP